MNAIILRNGKELVEPKKPKEKEPYAKVEEHTQKVGKYEIPMKHSKGVGGEERSSTYVAPPTYDPPIPYPQRV